MSMSDIKNKIIRKMQSGGITYRGNIQIAERKLMYSPHLLPGQRSGGGGYGGGQAAKPSSSSASDTEAGDMYKSHKTLIRDIQAMADREITDINNNTRLNNDQKKVAINNIIEQGRSQINLITESGVQLKESLSKFDESGSRMKNISSEHIINVSTTGSNPEVLVQLYAPNKAGERYSFVNATDAKRLEQAKQGSIMTVSNAINSAKLDPSFVVFLEKRGIDLASKLNGIVTHEQARDSVDDFFENANVYTIGEENSEFMMGGTKYISANVVADAKAGKLTEVADAYIKSASAPHLARLRTEAAMRGGSRSWVDYLNDFILGKLKIDIKDPEDSSKETVSGQKMTALMNAYTGGSTQVETHTYNDGVPSLQEYDKDSFIKKSRLSQIKVDRNVTYLPNAAGTIDPDKERGDYNSILASHSDIIMGLAKTGTIKDDLNLLNSGENVYRVLTEQIGISKQQAQMMIEGIHVRTDANIGISYAIGLAGENKSSRDLERMVAIVGGMITGGKQYEELGFKDGLQAEWFKGDNAPSEEKYRKEHKDLISQWQEGGATAEQITAKVKDSVGKQMQGFPKKMFTKTVVNGDAIYKALRSKGIKEEEARVTAARWKAYLRNNAFQIQPQIEITVDIPIYNGSVEDDFADLSPYIGGELYEATDHDKVRFKNAGVEAYYRTKVLIDATTNKLGVTVAGSRNNTTQKADLEVDKTLLADIDINFNTEYELHNLDLFNKPLWEKLQ